MLISEFRTVLILVVVDDGLVPNDELHTYARSTVLILVVVDDGLVLRGTACRPIVAKKS